MTKSYRFTYEDIKPIIQDNRSILEAQDRAFTKWFHADGHDYPRFLSECFLLLAQALGKKDE